ncbi:hypothetical protein POL68_11745 [Stigmatella sp. ncwal1]|uniref:Uncharacterized protein n=1 Tax=Stigmatella ashevillensis TaxID=2995309 RepID=A0ABT5D655_9BACT|nr:hypothetical protein [Stigmatella ashevillena]MDC0709137.1 hypothetical protein [Stigmatella ashevillena]
MAPSKRQWFGILVAVTAFLSALGAALFWQAGSLGVGTPQAAAQNTKSGPALQNTSLHAEERATGIPSSALARLGEKAAGLAQQRLEAIPNPIVQEDVGGFPQHAVEQVLGSYREMQAVQGLYNQRVERERLTAQILKSPQGLDIASKALTDFNFTREAFGEFQAEARYYSIDVLKTAASQGNAEPLVRATTHLVQQLSGLSADAEDFKKGRREDLYDLICGFIDVVGEDFLATADAQVIQRLGYAPGLPPHLKKVYDDALFFRLNIRFGRARAAAITSSLLGG